MASVTNIQTFEQAKLYLKAGFSVIPLSHKSKTPLAGFSWSEYQKRKPTDIELESWFNDPTSQNNIGIVTGLVSKLIVIDIDPKNGGNESFEKLRAQLPQTYIVKTGSGGAHYYYRWTFESPAPNIKGFKPGIDVQGNGAYVVAPPSIHPNGNSYELVDGFDDISPAPEWLINLTREDTPSWENWIDGVTEGSRNAASASVCGRILFELNQEDWETKGWRQLIEWNKRNSPPLEEKELQATFKSILKRAHESAKNGESKSKPVSADSIVNLILKEDPTLFHDEQREGYIRIKVNDHHEVLKISSRTFGHIVNKKIWDEWRKIPSAETIKQSLTVLEAKAIHEGSTQNLLLRVTEKDGKFWYDLGDKEWRAVKIDCDGWSTVSETPILFRRYSHQQPQVDASTEGNVFEFLNYLNIPDSRQQTLVLIYLIASFIPGISHPILILHGQQGSSKSTALRLIRKLVDPSAIELLSFSKNQENLIQQLAHHYAAYFDNLSGVSNDISDLLCKAVTGESHSKRALYTDDDDIIFNFRNCLALNGINVVAFRSDLLDRSILIHLDRIEPTKRRLDSELMMNFEKDRPIILGGIFDTISQAMKLKDSIKLTTIPRMADFYLWGCAIAEALGIGQDAFIEAHEANEATKHEQVANENPVAMHLLAFMKSKYLWEGTAQKLYTDLSVGMELSAQKDKFWPQAANALMRRINEIKPDLKALGVEVQQSRGEERRLLITYNIPSESSDRQEEEVNSF